MKSSDLQRYKRNNPRYLLGTALLHQVVIYRAGFDGVDQVDHHLTIGYRRVLKSLDTARLPRTLQLRVHPLDDLLLDQAAPLGARQRREDRQRVRPHQLPDQRKGQRGVAVVYILAGDPHQREIHRFPKLDRVIAILQLLHELAQLGELLVHPIPVHRPGFDDVVKLEDDQTVGQVRVEPVHVGDHAHRVHPIPVRLLLPGLLQRFQPNVVLRLVQSRVIVEHVGDEREVQLVYAVHHVARRYETSTAELGRLLQHNLGAGRVVRLHHCLESDASRVGRDLFDQVGVDLRVGDVRLEVVTPSHYAGVLQVMVHPSEEDRLGREFQEILDSLPVLQQGGEAWTILEGDLVEQADSNDLPEEAEHEVGRAFGQVVGVYVHDVAPDRLGGRQRQR